ncbi:MAG TPA: hypothetical protein VN711_04870 [Candidatus Saccharimonadales bacterium]|nr:hypothetical protein [Candidatus Saccharimonadales bacterium]
MKYFYSHLIETDSLVVALSELGLSEEEKAHLLGIIESSLHHAILDAILSELSEKDKALFLEQLSKDDNEKIWEFLSSKIDGIEDKIKKTAKILKEELHKDISETKEK